MRKVLLFLAVIPALAFGQAKAPQRVSSTLWSLTERSMASSTSTGGYVLEDSVTLTRSTGQVTTVSGGGAGNTVITVTDGTNTCTFTFACTATATGGACVTSACKADATNGAGTGCSFAAGAVLSSTVSTAGCTTTQPTFRSLAFVAKRRIGP